MCFALFLLHAKLTVAGVVQTNAQLNAMNFESTSFDNPERISDLVFKFPSINWFIYPLITLFIYVRICLLNHLPVY